MASLNDLRTKGGWVLTIVLAVAMLAFVLGDLFSSGSIFASRQNRVGKINGETIDYQVYLNQTENVKNIYSMLWGSTAFNAEQYDMIYDEAWSDLIMTHAFAPSFENLGLTVSDAEIVDMIQGEYVSPLISSFFADPQTGVFSAEAFAGFVAQVENDPTAFAVWNYIKKRAAEQRLMSNYTNLVAEGMNANNIEVEKGVAMTNNASNAKIVSKQYYTIPDSVVTKPTSAEIKKYYKEHKELYRQSNSREVEYVVFNVEPSEADYAAAKAEIEALAEEFKAAENPMQFAAANSYDRPDYNYYSKDRMIDVRFKGIAFDGKGYGFYGPVLHEASNTYTIARVADYRMMPDSMEARHILLTFDQKDLADSIATALRKDIKQFGALAEKYSLDGTASNGGKLGRFAPEQMVPEFSNALVEASTGKVVVIESQFGIHVAQATWKGKNSRRAQIAKINYRVMPGDETLQAASNEANKFIAEAKASNFSEAASKLGLSKRSAIINNKDRQIYTLKDARELIRWSFNNKEEAVSNMMEIDGDYVVATVKKVRKEGYKPIEEVANSIATKIKNAKKAAYLAEQTKGLTTIEEVAEKLGTTVLSADELLGNANNITTLGPALELIGNIAVAPENTLVGPFVDDYSVEFFFVESRTAGEDATVESEKVRLDAAGLYRLENRLDEALEQTAKVDDNRTKFF
ncbi:MAG: SurA N-terminal domain-containing protein [Tidjanibacter sp.]|nr:SurA N-terminal domain-containing protein [Tidjanibacter sp.]